VYVVPVCGFTALGISDLTYASVATLVVASVIACVVAVTPFGKAAVEETVHTPAFSTGRPVKAAVVIPKPPLATGTILNVAVGAPVPPAMMKSPEVSAAVYAAAVVDVP
jgi:hypothetical protein